MSKTMSEYDRNFARRHITWKLTNVTRESLGQIRESPKFTISLGDIKTIWYSSLLAYGQQLYLYVKKVCSETGGFSAKISAGIKKMKPNPAYQRSVILERLYDDSSPTLTVFDAELVPLDVLFDEKNELLDGTDLTLEIQIELIENAKVEMPPKASRSWNNFEKLINSDKYSDFVFICSDGERIHVHKAIIAVQCEVFATMVEARWSKTKTNSDYDTLIEAGLSEMKTNSVKIADVDSETMTELVRFLYSGRVENMKEVQERLLVAANEYRLEDLKNLCVSSLMESLTDENVVNVFGIADLLGEEHLKNNCIDYMKCHHLRLQSRIEKEDFPKELLWALWKSIDSHPIRIWFENGQNM